MYLKKHYTQIFSMEPVTTTIAISTVVGYLAKKLKDNKSVQSFFNDFTEASVNWIRPIFLRQDGSPKDVLSDLQVNPDSNAQQDVVKSTIAVALEKNSQAESIVREMAAIIQSKKDKGESITISSSKNVNTGTVSAGGNVMFGDNNNVTK